jgi:TRAP-type C4-dicarboxylate transport system substrate-binding protein
MRQTTMLFGWLTVLALMAGCTGPANTDKAGGEEEPVVLRMANGYGNLDYEPALAYFVERVAELSDGAFRIEVVDEWGGSANDFEQQIIRDVATGEVDVGWVGTRVFDTVDVLSLQALTAPMLIDSYPLQEAVIESEIPGQMLEGLEKLDLAGLAVLADGLRKPIAVDGPLLAPEDWSGVTFQSFRSERQADAIRALGARPTDVIFGKLDAGIANGQIQGFEKNLLIYQINAMDAFAPYITANVNLWPQTVAIVANPDRLAELSEQHREWLTKAANDAAGLSPGLADQDAPIVAAMCESGARFANASEADLAALRDAFAPVYQTLRQDSQTAGFIDQIESMKQSTPAGDGLAIPAACTGAAEAPAPPGLDEPATALNGTYRWTITEEDAVASPTEDKSPEHLATFPWVMTITLQNGAWTLSNRSAEGNHLEAAEKEFTVSGDRITFQWDGAELPFTFSVDGVGNLHLVPVEPMNAGDQFVWASHPWTKID